MPQTAHALWFPKANTAELRPEPPGEGTLIHAAFGAISRGTESLVFAGNVPPDQYDAMRGPNQGGSFPFPVKYGYATVGHDDAGQAHFCLHPHQDHFHIAETTPIPATIPPGRAILAANMETALTVVWDARIQPGDRVNVFGAGVIGLLTAHLATRIAGTEVRINDLNPTRTTIAAALNIPFGPPQPDADVCINATASDAALTDAITHAAPNARVVEASWFGTRPATIPLGGAFHSKRLQIIASQVGSIPPDHAPRWTHARRLAKAVSLLTDPALDALISGETAFTDLPAQYARILADPDTLCHRIKY